LRAELTFNARIIRELIARTVATIARTINIFPSSPNRGDDRCSIAAELIAYSTPVYWCRRCADKLKSYQRRRDRSTHRC